MSLDKYHKLIIGVQLGEVLTKIETERIRKPKFDEFTAEKIKDESHLFVVYYALLNGEKIEIGRYKPIRNRVPNYFSLAFENLSKEGKYDDEENIVSFGDLQIIKSGYESTDYLNDYYLGIEIDQSKDTSIKTLKPIEDKVQSQLLKHFDTFSTAQVHVLEYWS